MEWQGTSKINNAKSGMTMLVTRVSKTFSLVILRALGLEIQSFVADSWLAVLPRPQLIYVLVYPLSPLEGHELELG